MARRRGIESEHVGKTKFYRFKKGTVMVDTYTKFILTFIAICLVALIFMKFEPRVTAQSSVNCTGTLKSNAFGGAEPIIGGYNVSVRCR